ncbi:hypothetical protein GOBAR_AA05957 [Gossypium barbadense]|uniref:Uncharacterized protein n=1 Tax=Gossypium barbadense TaxID=3634 RepID=A0A2P5YGG1_GOSBA|nr:hypothetical protein GOBAR_AA05957 [Gossypium barbadense]
MESIHIPLQFPLLVHYVYLTRKESCRPCFEEKEGSVIFLGSHRENSSRFPAVPYLGHCIDWAALEQIQLADTILALLTIDPWELFFEIAELTYLELTMELCSTFHLQTVMARFDDPGTIQFRLGGLVRQLNVPEFRTEGGHLHWALCDTVGSALWAPQHSSPIILPHSHGPDVPIGHLEHAKYEGDRETTWHLPFSVRLTQFTKEETPEDITDDFPPHHEDPPSQPPPPSRPVHAATSYTDISKRLTRSSNSVFNVSITLMLLYSRFVSTFASHRHPHLELKTPPGKVLHNCHVLLDHDYSYHQI